MRLLELTGILNERLSPDQEFIGLSMTRVEIADLLNYYVIENHYEETKTAVPPFTPDDDRLTDSVCDIIIKKIADSGWDCAMNDDGHDTVYVATNEALPEVISQLKRESRRAEIAKKRQRQ